MRHVGVRPTHHPLELAEIRKRRKLYYENFPDGSYRMWNEKLLNSGCGGNLTKVLEENNLLYCPVCREWCSKEQFKDESD